MLLVSQKPSLACCMDVLPPAHLPVVEHREAEGLALCVVAQVRLKAKALDDRQERLDDEDGGAGSGHVGGDVATALCQHVVNGTAAAGRVIDSVRVGGILSRENAYKSC